MTREQVQAIVGEQAVDWVMPHVERALALGYQPEVRVNRKGHIEIGVSVVLSEWAEGEREEED
jgi:hypothetical protein